MLKNLWADNSEWGGIVGIWDHKGKNVDKVINWVRSLISFVVKSGADKVKLTNIG